MPIRTSDFDFELPAELIAQAPIARRDESRLMVVNRANGEISHRQFRDLLELVPANDLLVLNTTKVFPARLLGVRDSGAAAEVLLPQPAPTNAAPQAAMKMQVRNTLLRVM